MKSLEQQLRGQARKFQLMTSGLLVFVVLTTFYFWIFTKQRLNNFQLVRQQVEDLKVSFQSRDSLNQFLSQNQDGIKLVSLALPNEDNVVEFVSQVENLLAVTGLTGSLKFSSIVPAKANDQLYIPFILKLQTGVPQFLDFLARLEKLPFLVQLTGVTITSPNGIADITDITIGARLYVQDPFQD